MVVVASLAHAYHFLVLATTGFLHKGCTMPCLRLPRCQQAYRLLPLGAQPGAAASEAMLVVRCNVIVGAGVGPNAQLADVAIKEGLVTCGCRGV